MSHRSLRCCLFLLISIYLLLQLLIVCLLLCTFHCPQVIVVFFFNRVFSCYQKKDWIVDFSWHSRMRPPLSSCMILNPVCDDLQINISSSDFSPSLQISVSNCLPAISNFNKHFKTLEYDTSEIPFYQVWRCEDLPCNQYCSKQCILKYVYKSKKHVLYL